MTTFKSIPHELEAFQIPKISSFADPFDFPNKPVWLERAIDLGQILPDMYMDTRHWCYALGNKSDHVGRAGDWFVLHGSGNVYLGEHEEFSRMYTQADIVVPEHNALDSRYDEMTLHRVYAALISCDLLEDQAIAAVNAMQNAGILFRERR